MVRALWRLGPLALALAFLALAAAPSQACHGQTRVALASPQIAAESDAAAPAVSLWATPADSGCCTGVSHASGGCANGSCAPCSAALADSVTLVEPPVMVANVPLQPEARTLAIPLRNFRPPRAA